MTASDRIGWMFTAGAVVVFLVAALAVWVSKR